MPINPELSSHPVVQEYAKFAPDYDARWSFYIRATTEATVARLPRSLGAVLDIGCGTGALLLRLTTECPDAPLTGVDASPEMLDIARSRLPPTVELHQSWAEGLPFGDLTFDTVISCNMFHYIRNPEVALREMLRVLRPQGTLIITDWCDDYIVCKICDLYLRLFDPSHFRMYGISTCRRLLQSTQAEAISIETYKISWLWGLMTAIAHKPSVGKDL